MPIIICYFVSSKPIMRREETSAKPFIKWVGGKTQLLGQLSSFFPKRLYTESFTYIEPFVGGGAMLFFILRHFSNVKRAVINDINENLIRAYQTIKKEPQQLIRVLGNIENDYLSINNETGRKQFFLDIRAEFNTHPANSLTNTAYLIFLNKTCFNGLYRVNRNGKFNVPFGKYAHPTICNAEVILSDSALLNQFQVEITTGSYLETEELIDNRGLNFIYFDPPYRPLSATSSFTSYTQNDFSDADQAELAALCTRISSPQCLWMLSNADCKAHNPTDDFFERHYAQFHINKVWASRALNSNPQKRGKLTELLIHNDYETADQPL